MKLQRTQLSVGYAILAVFFVSPAARADGSKQLANYFGQKIAQVNLALTTMKPDVANEPFIFQDFQINLAPLVSFGINSFLNVTVAPEIDFILTQAAPVVDPADHAGQPPNL